MPSKTIKVTKLTPSQAASALGRKLVEHAIMYIRFDRWDGTSTTCRTTELDQDELDAVNVLAGAILDLRHQGAK